MSDTNPERFVDTLAHELRLRGVPTLRSELRPWVRACWPHIEGDPSPGRWATAWQEQRQPAGAE
jgi:hypothetical protein